MTGETNALSDEQARWVMRRVSLWVTTRQIWGYADDHPITGAEVDHSALLYRLLRGLDPLPKPPPLRHSYPDYP